MVQGGGWGGGEALTETEKDGESDKEGGMGRR